MEFWLELFLRCVSQVYKKDQSFEKNGLVCSLEVAKIGLVKISFLLDRFLYNKLRVVTSPKFKTVELPPPRAPLKNRENIHLYLKDSSRYKFHYRNSITITALSQASRARQRNRAVSAGCPISSMVKVNIMVNILYRELNLCLTYEVKMF